VQLSDDELKAAVETAHRLGRRVACHALGVAGIRAAVAAGADTIEHGIHLHEDPELLDTMAARHVYLVPTLKLTAFLSDEARAGVPAAVQEKAKRAKAHHVESLCAALRHGVPIAMGTDCGSGWNRHGENLMELVLLVEAGMTPMQAIVASTSTAAEAIGMSDRIGTLEPGKRADIAIVRGNPLDNIAAVVEAPEAVFLDGRRLSV
jgi:imidazolonepropionase-like amidohydrolase